jgi:hypothetical protein
MHTLRTVASVVFAIVGTIWIGQGVGLLPGSFMTNDLRWAAAGAALIVAAGLLTWWEGRSRR